MTPEAEAAHRDDRIDEAQPLDLAAMKAEAAHRDSPPDIIGDPVAWEAVAGRFDEQATLPPRPTQYRRGWAAAHHAAADMIRAALAAQPLASRDDPLLCSPGCGSLQWTVAAWGRVTHKHGCERRTDPFCQTHPRGCPDAGLHAASREPEPPGVPEPTEIAAMVRAQAWRVVAAQSEDGGIRLRREIDALRRALDTHAVASREPVARDAEVAQIAAAVSDALSAMTEGGEETQAPTPSDEPGSPYVNGIAAALYDAGLRATPELASLDAALLARSIKSLGNRYPILSSDPTDDDLGHETWYEHGRLADAIVAEYERLRAAPDAAP